MLVLAESSQKLSKIYALFFEDSVSSVSFMVRATEVSNTANIVNCTNLCQTNIGNLKIYLGVAILFIRFNNHKYIFISSFKMQQLFTKYDSEECL